MYKRLEHKSKRYKSKYQQLFFWDSLKSSLNLAQSKKSYEKRYIDNVEKDENGYYIVDDMHLDEYQYQALTRGLFRTPRAHLKLSSLTETRPFELKWAISCLK